MQLDTLNSNGVAAFQGRVVFALGPCKGASIAPVDALRLAAWLIVGAELAGYGENAEDPFPGVSHALADVIDTKKAIEST